MSPNTRTLYTSCSYNARLGFSEVEPEPVTGRRTFLGNPGRKQKPDGLEVELRERQKLVLSLFPWGLGDTNSVFEARGHILEIKLLEEVILRGRHL